MNGGKGQPDVQDIVSGTVVHVIERKSKRRSSMQANQIGAVGRGEVGRSLQDLSPGMGIIRQGSIGDATSKSSMFRIGLMSNAKEKFGRFSKPQHGPPSVATTVVVVAAEIAAGRRRGVKGAATHDLDTSFPSFSSRRPKALRRRGGRPVALSGRLLGRAGRRCCGYGCSCCGCFTTDRVAVVGRVVVDARQWQWWLLLLLVHVFLVVDREQRGRRRRRRR